MTKEKKLSQVMNDCVNQLKKMERLFVIKGVTGPGQDAPKRSLMKLKSPNGIITGAQ